MAENDKTPWGIENRAPTIEELHALIIAAENSDIEGLTEDVKSQLREALKNILKKLG